MGKGTAACSPSPAIDKYEAEDAARTLTKAEDIKANPQLHRAAHKHIGKQIRQLKRVAAVKPAPMSRRK